MNARPFFLGGSGNTVYGGGGTDTVVSRAGHDTVMAATSGAQTIAGFTTTNGDVLDLRGVLAGTGAAADLSDLGGHVTLTQQQDARHAGGTDTVLSVKGVSGTASITLLDTGTISLADLASHHSVLVA